MSDFLTAVGIITVTILLLILFIGTAFSLSWALWEVIFPALDRFLNWFKDAMKGP